MQGSGTFAVESVLGSVVPRPAQGGRILIASNGAYGDRMAQMCRYYGIDHHVLRFGEREAVCSDAVAAALRNPPIAIGSGSADATAARPKNPSEAAPAMAIAAPGRLPARVGRPRRVRLRDLCSAFWSVASGQAGRSIPK